MFSLLGVLAEEGVKVAEKAADINPVVPDDMGEIFWSAVTFFGLWILLRYVCLPPLLKIREERAAKAQADREAASAAESQTEQVRRDYDTTLAEARAQAGRIVEEARAESDARRADAVRQAEAEAATTRQGALAEIDDARTQALAGLRGEVSDIAISAASTVMGTNLELATNQSTIDNFVDQASTKR